jgi:PD-(D/E)XK nuclease superfamily
MLGTHEHADNLFLRLSSYSQRKDRDPLEDFCSEALVWCLRNSLSFRKRFLDLTRMDIFQRNTDVVIHSQQRYEEEINETGSPNETRGRFDIVFEATDSSFFIALESKVGSGFGRNQISKYLRRLHSIRKALPTTECALITLTNVREGPVESSTDVKHLFWGDVHRELHAIAGTTPKDSANDSKESREMLKQFGQFLKLKGLAYMKISTTTPDSLKQLVQASQLRNEIEAILSSLKTSKHLKPLLSRKRIKFEPEKTDASIGIYGSWNPFFYVGFALHETSTAPKMSLYIERSLLGKRTDVAVPKDLKRYSRQPKFDKGQTWFVFEKPVDKTLNGDANAMIDWFNKTSKLVLAIGGCAVK